MIQEEKQLLLVDLCARLPYGVKVKSSRRSSITILSSDILTDLRLGCTVKSFLRPMSSMTEEEENEWNKLQVDPLLENALESHTKEDSLKLIAKSEYSPVDWLIKNHFDFRGLIEMGLALEAPTGMYRIESSDKDIKMIVPKSIHEALDVLDKILSDEDREYLLKNGAISMHDSLGRWIRNEWGLWTGSELKNELINMNKGLNHPDDMSNYILEKYIEFKNNTEN